MNVCMCVRMWVCSRHRRRGEHLLAARSRCLLLRAVHLTGGVWVWVLLVLVRVRVLLVLMMLG